MKNKKEYVKTLERDDKRYIWHPFTQMMDYMRENPLIIMEGKGIYVYDQYRNRYIDGVSSLWVNIHGHRKKEIDKAVKEQLAKIAHSTLLGPANEPAVKLAKELVKITPKGLNKVFYSDNGSTAVEIALKMAFQYWKHKGKRKEKFIYFTNAYHGDTIGSVSVGGIDTFHEIFHPLLFKSYKVDYPYCYRCRIGSYPSCKIRCISKLEKTLKKNCKNIAAVVIEPLIQGSAGMITSPPEFILKVRQLAKRYNILLILDEVATGFGRTGKMFACDHVDIKPDFMCLAKGMSGGYLPLAATLTTDEIFNAFLGEYKDLKSFFHGHTYTGNPLGCSAALANLEIFKKEKILNKLKTKIRFLRRYLGKFNKLEHVGDIRQCGFMVGIELVKNKKTKASYPLKDKIGIKVCLKAREYGVLIRPLGNVIVIMPPLSISIKELKRLLKSIYLSIESVT